MNRRLSALAALAAVSLISAGCGNGSGPRAGSAGRLVPIGSGLTGPAGLKATVYAQGLAKAAALALDPQGRLWVATADYTYHGHDGVYLVPSPGAAPLEVLAGLHTPLGLLWYGPSLYVASTGRVDAYSGFDGKSFASRRAIVILPPGSGEDNGIVLSPDGRLLMGISAPCDHCTPKSKWSATIISFRPDGSDVRIDDTGIRAPVGLAYYPGTGDLFVTMNQRDDLAAETPGDWLALVRPGQAWGFPACYGQGGSACEGVPEPTAVLDKHAAVSGIAILSGQLGPVIGSSAIVAEWAAGKVQRVELHKDGPDYTGSTSPFLQGLKNPVPVVITADGALLVGDWTTGTIYRVSNH